MVLMMTGCGGNGNTEPVTESAAAATTQDASPEVAAELEWQDDPTAYLSGINAADYVELPDDYTFLTVEVAPVAEVTDEDINNKIDEERERRRELQEVDGRNTVEEGDIANIDYVGRIDGKEFDGGSYSGYNLEIGSGTFIDGFESGLIGHEVGETVTLELTFPENYSDSTKAGKAAEFDVTINSIQEYIVPELTGDFVVSLGIKDVFGGTISTVDEFRTYVRNYLINLNERDYTYRLEGAIKEALFDKSTFKKEIPGAMQKRYSEYVTQQLSQRAWENGIDLKTYMQIAHDYAYGHTDDYDYLQDIEEMAAERAQKFIILKAIGDKEKLIMTDDEFRAELENAVNNSNSGYTSAEEVPRYVVEEFREALDSEKIMDFLKSKTKVVAPASEEGSTGETAQAAESATGTEAGAEAVTEAGTEAVTEGGTEAATEAGTEAGTEAAQ